MLPNYAFYYYENDFFYQEYSFVTGGGKGVCLDYITDPDSPWSGIYDFGNNMFVKVDWSETDYDTVSYKTSTNSTTVTGDLDNTASSLSLGISF